jgi:hypothetical protein
MDRGIMGSGHGWTIGWAVAWNCQADTMLIQQPPGSMNWAIGCTAKMTTRGQPGSTGDLTKGTIESSDHPVDPKSLYLAQLAERLGPGAVRNIGY